MYSDPGFIVSVGGAAFFILFGLFYLVAARRRARTIRVLEQRGRAIAVEVTSIRFKALKRLGSSYGRVSFIYEYEGKVYEHKQAIEELSAQDLLRHSTHPYVLVLPEKPRCATRHTCLSLIFFLAVSASYRLHDYDQAKQYKIHCR
jgi:hypothetical protein